METAAGIWIVSAENCHLSVLYISLSVFLHSVSRERLTCLAHAEWPCFSHVCWLLVEGGVPGRAFSFPSFQDYMCWRRGSYQGKSGFSYPRKGENCCTGGHNRYSFHSSSACFLSKFNTAVSWQNLLSVATRGV